MIRDDLRPAQARRPSAATCEGEWELRYATKSSLVLVEMARQFPGNVAEAKARLRTAPTTRSATQKRLRDVLGTRVINGVALDQWQIDITSSARLWYCVDEDARVVWLTLAAAGHPRATEAKGGRAPRSRWRL